MAVRVHSLPTSMADLSEEESGAVAPPFSQAARRRAVQRAGITGKRRLTFIGELLGRRGYIVAPGVDDAMETRIRYAGGPATDLSVRPLLKSGNRR
jgi:hypothetical protein